MIDGEVPKCTPLAVFCRRCLQPRSRGCLDLTRRAPGSTQGGEPYPEGIFHGCRIEDAQKYAVDLERERRATWHI